MCLLPVFYYTRSKHVLWSCSLNSYLVFVSFKNLILFFGILPLYFFMLCMSECVLNIYLLF